LLFIEQFPIVFDALNVGFIQTLKLFIITLVGALPFGLVIAFGSMSKFKPLSAFVKTLVWVIRGTPLMLQLLVIYYLPGLVFHNNIWGSGEDGRFIASITAFIINYACYFSEIFRGGIESITKGQYEAGYVLGMTKKQIFKEVVLLQVIKRIIAPMSNEVITLVKDTALARVIGVIEIIKVADVFASTKALIWPLFYTGVFYLVFVGLLTIIFGKLEKKLSYFKA
jgi:polar amino acid transport system permease protein